MIPAKSWKYFALRVPNISPSPRSHLIFAARPPMGKIRDMDRFPRRIHGESVRADVKTDRYGLKNDRSRCGRDRYQSKIRPNGSKKDWCGSEIERFGSEKYPCGSKNATNADSSAVYLITMPPRDFPNFCLARIFSIRYTGINSLVRYLSESS
jgi:hypothetical protein